MNFEIFMYNWPKYATIKVRNSKNLQNAIK